MTIETAVATSAGLGIEKLMEFGLLGILAALGLAFMFWTAYQCSKHTKEGLDNNTKAMHGIEIALVKIEAKLEK
jgi:hypothetical protein